MFSSRKTGSASNNYLLTRSLRFRSSASAYLNRTPASAGNQQKFTWSGWVKRGTLGTSTTIFGCYSSGTLLETTYFDFRFNTDSLDANWGNGTWFTTTAVYRDPSAWYHIVLAVDTTQATSSNRMILYVNGVQVTAFSYTSYPAQNTNLVVNTASGHTFGKSAFNSSAYLDGYLAEVNFIDGQALTPSSFGSTNAATGVWQPIKYTGTYGTNGFYLPFTDTTSTTTISEDFSGNNNDWTSNNISLTSGATYDSMTDVPTLTSATTANYCVLNPLGGSANTIQNGNLQLTGTAAGNTSRVGSLAVSSGKWYFETTITTLPSGQDPLVGVSNVNSSNLFTTYPGESSTSYSVYLYQSNSFIQKVNNNTFTNTNATTIAQGDVIGVALDLDNGKIWFSKNGTFVDSGSPTGGTNAQFTGLSGSFVPAFRGTGGASTTTLSPNFGQQPFSYTPPTGFVALNTFNLHTPTIGATASSQANRYFDILTYTGTGGTRTLTGLNFQPDFVWSKSRSSALNHTVFDVVRGVGNSSSSKSLVTNNTETESWSSANFGYLSSFNSDGVTFTAGSTNNDQYNQNTVTYVQWNWRANGTGVTNTAGSITSTVSANTTAGFSVVTYTGTGANATVGHGLGVAPSMIITKSSNDATYGWTTYHASVGAGAALFLNTTGASNAGANIWNNTSPTSSVFSIGTDQYANFSGKTYVAYCFAQVDGYSAFGSYTGNGSSDGVFIYTGFRPRFVMYKNASYAGTSWAMLDSSRNTYNVLNARLFADGSDAENTATTPMDFTSNGFKVRSTNDGVNRNGDTIIYMAFAESPFKYANAR